MEYKGYKIVGDGVYGYSHIKPLSRGSVPAKLNGTYTTKQFAMNAIDFYISNKKGKVNGKADISN